MRIFKNKFSNKAFLYSENAWVKQYLAELRGEWEEYAKKPIEELAYSLFCEFSKTGNRLAYEGVYFTRRKMLRNFALMSWLYDDERALSRLEDIMWAICNEFTWALPAHITGSVFECTIDLFAAETAQSLAEIISLLEDKLSEDVMTRCVGEIKKRVLKPFVNRKEPYGWESSKSNWSAVCGGCIGMTALYLEDDEEARRITDELKPVIQNYISGFADDGACLEGLGYWNYGMTYFTAYIDLYELRMGERYVIDEEKLAKMAAFPCVYCMTDGITASFSDSSDHEKIYAGLSSGLHALCGSLVAPEEYFAGFSDDECGRWCRVLRDIVWYKSAAEAKTGGICPDAQTAVLGAGNYMLAFKGGSNAEMHNHNDIGSIIVVKDGNIILADLGAGEYIRDYFSDGRYGILTNRSAGHSVPIIDGCEQCAGASYAAKDFYADEKSVSADIGGAYEGDVVKSCIRTAVIDKDGVFVHDSFMFDGGGKTVTERFITRLDAKKIDGGVVITAGGERAAALIAKPECSVEIKKHNHREHDGSMSRITSVDFTFKSGEEGEFYLKIV